MRFSWWWIWNLCSEIWCCIVWWTGFGVSEVTTAFIFRVDEPTKMHSVHTGEDNHLTLWSLLNKLRNLLDMTWNKNISYRQNSWHHMSTTHYSTLHYSTLHYATLHLYFLSVKILEISIWTVPWISFKAVTIIVRFSTFFFFFPWEIWLIMKSF